MRPFVLLLALVGLAATAPRASADLKITLEGLPTSPVTAGSGFDFRIRLTGESTSDVVQLYQIALRVQGVGSGGTAEGSSAFTFDIGSNPNVTPPSAGYVFGANSSAFVASVEASDPGLLLISDQLGSGVTPVRPVAGVNDLIFTGRIQTGSAFAGTLNFSFDTDQLFIDEAEFTPAESLERLRSELSNLPPTSVQVLAVPEPASVVLLAVGLPGVLAMARLRRRG